MELSWQFSSKNFIRFLLITFLASFLLSFNLWGNDRTFPLFPIFHLETSAKWIHLILQYGFLILTIICIGFPKKSILKSWLAYLVILICVDQLRLQSWVYFIGICLLPFAFKIKEIDVLKYLRISFIILYLWSGYHKFNENFTVFIFESIIVDGFNIGRIENITILKKFSYLIPITEITIAISLLFKQTRKFGLVVLATTHLFIIYYLVFGIRGNFVVIPWNLLMILIGYLLFYKNKKTLNLPKVSFLKISLTIISLLPIGFLMGKIDQTVSFSLYDAKLKSLYALEKTNPQKGIYLDPKLIKKGSIKDFNLWSFKELNVPFYPEKRFIEQLKLNNKNKEERFLVTETPLWKRSLLGEFKTTKELETYQLIDTIKFVVFTKTLYFPNFKIID